MRIPPSASFLIASVLCLVLNAKGQLPPDCVTQDSTAAMGAIRERLARWVTQTNQGDRAAAGTIWAAQVTGWFPHGPEFTDSAAYATAGLPKSVGPATSTYAVKIDEVAVAAGLAAVHDIWKETRRFPGAAVTVTREIRGSELWRCQPDGSWRIRRWVSAPEHWIRSP